MPVWEEEPNEYFQDMGDVRFMTIELTFEKKVDGKRKRETRSYNVLPTKILAFIDDLAICNTRMEYPRGMLQCWFNIAKEQEAAEQKKKPKIQTKGIIDESHPQRQSVKRPGKIPASLARTKSNGKRKSA